MRRFAPLALSLAALAGAPAPAAAAPARAALTPAAAATEAAHQAAMDGYLYFYPLVTMDLTRRQFTHPSQGAQGAPSNTFLHVRTLPQPGAATPWANPDMLRSTGWLDLTAGPVVLSVPDTQGRRYTLTLLDMWTDVFAALGKRTTGTAKGNTVIVPPGWTGTLPSGMARIDAPTVHVWAKVLIQTDGPADYAAVNAMQDGFTLTPLAQWNLPAQSQRVKSDPNLDLKIPVREQVESMPTDAFFTYAAELLRKHPPHATDQPVLAQLRRVGLIAGRTFEFDRLDYPAKQGMRRGLRAGRERMEAAAGGTLRAVNGWQQETASVGVYGSAYLRRALAAQAQPGSGLPEDQMVLLLAADSQGAPIDGAHRYVLHFESGQLPPAGAAWSLAAYDGQGMPVANLLNRYALGDRAPLRYNADGSLDVHISHAPPAPEEQPNWLPVAAAGPVTVLLRAYEPGPALLDGLWMPPALVRDEPQPVAQAAPAADAPVAEPVAEAPPAAPAAAPVAKKP
ncbi:hypothetical protein CEY09_29065 [Achromobacter marplatensis]|uniref:DUF1254 domain-containing protein n=2 Tax=Achromobacter marplatensis TaxID=470868 RepID=A0ABX9G284_9BURK|nr:DUF1254 domain-containing protein [Achromobacter marplatensis]OWT56665.1 hypothetical protein CEY09_29065 [Achromobacter marplatensis]RBP12384.1 hypothetical protein DFP87_11963 [Achromobacter marplatensis]CAB3705181.1 hypothetical protein LMG26219_05587 [Achromobacter marplatensis]